MSSNCLLIKKLIFVIFFLFTISFCYGQEIRTEISGYVTDVTGEPLIGASVYLQKAKKGTLTDAKGYFTIKDIAPDTYNLVASYVGYISQTKFNIQVKSVGNQLYNFSLAEQSKKLAEVVVTPDENTVTRPIETPLSTQTLTGVELATYPGGNNDVVRVAQSLPGISPSVGGFRNDLIIRGGAPNESVYYLDGVEIPNINHFSTQGSAGGPVGILNVSFIDDVTLSTSAFGAQYDNPLSGVLQFSQIEGNRRKFSGNFRVSASEAAITLNGPLFKKKKEESRTSFIASVRRSYLQFLFKLIGLPIRPDYWDYQYRLTHKIDDYNTLHITGVGSIDDFTIDSSSGNDIDPNEQATLEQAPFIEQQTNAIGVTWRNRFKRSRGFMETTVSNNFLLNDFSRFEDNRNKTGLFFNNDARESETKMRYAITNFVEEWKIVAGLNLQYSDYRNKTIDLNNDIDYSSEIDFFKYGFFATASKSFVDGKLNFSFGFRMDDDTFTEGSDIWSTFSPRLALSYEFVPSWKINGTVGRYYKLPPYTILGFRDNNGNLVNKDVKYTRSDHYVIGIEKVLTPASSISLEGFYKYYDDYPVSVADSVSLANKGADFEVLGNENVETVGRGRSYGLELLFQQKLFKNFYGIFSYTYFFSEFTGFDRDEYKPSLWDSRHLVSFTGGYRLKKGWEISARWRFAGETPFVPTDVEATTEVYPEIVLDYSRLGEEFLDPFSQVDFRIDKKWNFKKWSLNVFLDIQNILAQSIPQPPEYTLVRDADGNPVEPQELFEVPQEEGSPIPTVGVVIDF